MNKLLTEVSSDTGHDDTMQLKIVQCLPRQWKVSLFKNAKQHNSIGIVPRLSLQTLP